MSDYRNRPKGDYIQDAALQNNLEFQLFEIEFLERLINTYYGRLSRKFKQILK